MNFKNMQFSGRAWRAPGGGGRGIGDDGGGRGGLGRRGDEQWRWRRPGRLREEAGKGGAAGQGTGRARGRRLRPRRRLLLRQRLAKPGEPKIIKLDPKTKKSEGIHTDKTGLYTSTQFDSQGNLWVTDFGGKIDEMKPDGSDFKTTYGGKLATGADDLAFDKQGNMFVTDTTGNPWEPTGDLLWLTRRARTRRS